MKTNTVLHYFASYVQNILEIGPGGLEHETVEHGRGVGEGQEGSVKDASGQHTAMEWNLIRKKKLCNKSLVS